MRRTSRKGRSRRTIELTSSRFISKRRRRTHHFDWHDAPQSQYVITLSGTLEFTSRDGMTIHGYLTRPVGLFMAKVFSGERTSSGEPWDLTSNLLTETGVVMCASCCRTAAIRR